MGFQPSSLDRLEAISHHPSIRKGVKHVTISLNFFSKQLRNDFTAFVDFYSKKLKDHAESEWGTREESRKRSGWNDAYHEADRVYDSWRRIMASTVSNSAKDEEDEAHRALLQEAHKKYQHDYDQQQMLKTSGKFVETVASALARMPLAKGVDIDDSTVRNGQTFWNIPVRPSVDV